MIFFTKKSLINKIKEWKGVVKEVNPISIFVKVPEGRGTIRYLMGRETCISECEITSVIFDRYLFFWLAHALYDVGVIIKKGDLIKYTSMDEHLQKQKKIEEKSNKEYEEAIKEHKEIMAEINGAIK